MLSLLDKAISERAQTQHGEPRRMGVEVELAGVEPNLLAELVQTNFGGEVSWISPFEIVVEATEFGDFKLELDSKQIKEMGERSDIVGDPAEEPKGFARTYIEFISGLAVNLVPWEIVTPPIPLHSITKLYPLVEQLREEGAKGTRDAIHFAFGVHLNPELTDLEADTIVRHLRSFFCLYEWIRQVEQTDFARRVTPYIDHFDNDYVALVLDSKYSPDAAQLIDDYLELNPTRNRSLDMLPLFAHLDETRVEERISDDRIKARPTFHYRLPNCDIDNPDWNLDLSIEVWMAVEALAADQSLQSLCDEYRAQIKGLLPVIGSHWAGRVEQHLREHNLLPSVADRSAA